MKNYCFTTIDENENEVRFSISVNNSSVLNNSEIVSVNISTLSKNLTIPIPEDNGLEDSIYHAKKFIEEIEKICKANGNFIHSKQLLSIYKLWNPLRFV